MNPTDVLGSITIWSGGRRRSQVTSSTQPSNTSVPMAITMMAAAPAVRERWTERDGAEDREGSCVTTLESCYGGFNPVVECRCGCP
jgi:hypothetical protein